MGKEGVCQELAPAVRLSLDLHQLYIDLGQNARTKPDQDKQPQKRQRAFSAKCRSTGVAYSWLKVKLKLVNW